MTVYQGDSESNLLRFHQVSGYLNIDDHQLRLIIEDESLDFPYLKIGSNYIFSKEAIDNWIAKQRLTIAN